MREGEVGSEEKEVNVEWHWCEALALATRHERTDGFSSRSKCTQGEDKGSAEETRGPATPSHFNTWCGKNA